MTGLKTQTLPNNRICIMHSSATDHSAKETHSHRLASVQWVFLPTCLGTGVRGSKQAKIFDGGEGTAQKSCHAYMYIHFISLLCSATIFKTVIFFPNYYKLSWSYCHHQSGVVTSHMTSHAYSSSNRINENHV